jgi:hypothetical protein
MPRHLGATIAAFTACLVVVAGLAVDACSTAKEPRVSVTATRAKAKPRRPGPVRIGLVANSLDAGPEAESLLTEVRRSGARWLREEFRWNEVEPRPGELHWEKIDRMMREAAARRLRVLPLLIGTPAWVAPSMFELPANPRGFARFTARVARRYGPGGTFWRRLPRSRRHLAPRVFEVWNEPFTPQFSAGQMSAPRYAQLFYAAAAAGRRANPQTRYLLAVDSAYTSADGSRREWIPDLLAALPKVRRVTYGLAMHPYSVTESPTTYTPGAAERQFLRLREVRDAWGGSPRIWVTELGWSTCPDGTGCISEADQARYLNEAFQAVGSEPLGVQAMFIYRLRDLQPGNPSDREQWFGLRRLDGTPKPAWNVLQSIAERVR